MIRNGESHHFRSVNACQVHKNFDVEGVCIDYKIWNLFCRTLLFEEEIFCLDACQEVYFSSEGLLALDWILEDW